MRPSDPFATAVHKIQTSVTQRSHADVAAKMRQVTDGSVAATRDVKLDLAAALRLAHRIR